MPKVSDAHRESRRDQILDAAAACFLRNGVQATTVAEIIRESGLSAGAIYGYFPGKQALALAVMRREAGGRTAELEAEARENALSPGQIIASISAAFLRRRPAPALIVQMWGEAASNPDFEQIAAAAFEEIGTMLERHLSRWAHESQGMDEAAAGEWSGLMLPVVLSLLQGLILQLTLRPGFDLDRYIAGVDELFRRTG
jgi:AcrR family transcriptional regulator